MNGSITLTKNNLQNFPRITLSTIKVAAVIFTKHNTTIMLIYWRVEWPQNKPLSNW